MAGSPSRLILSRSVGFSRSSIRAAINSWTLEGQKKNSRIPIWMNGDAVLPYHDMDGGPNGRETPALELLWPFEPGCERQAVIGCRRPEEEVIDAGSCLCARSRSPAVHKDEELDKPGDQARGSRGINRTIVPRDTAKCMRYKSCVGQTWTRRR